MGNTERVDVVVVGAGIGGSAVAGALAKAGLSVLVLERQVEYTDHVRGEFLQPWGVAEAQRLGVFDTLVAAGGNVASRLLVHDEALTREESETGATPLGALLPEVPGALGIGHPVVCRALEAAAVSSGAQVIHGVSEVKVVAGVAPEVRYVGPEGERAVSCRIVIGADGRESGVRRQMGIELNRTDPRVFLAGLLVSGVEAWPEGDAVLGTEGDRLFYVFPQGGGKARLYLAMRADERARLSGSDRTAHFLEGFRLDSLPGSERFTEADAAGPCAGYPMYDSWVDDPVVDGVALVGDAGGFSDPVIGQGLSIALRDARMVSEALISSPQDWSPAVLDGYAEERAERMRRLRFAAQIFADCYEPRLAPVEERRRRIDLLNGADEDLFLVQAAVLCGAEAVPAKCFEDPVRDRLLASA
jgi:menaquinone-9 beta-reductase